MDAAPRGCGISCGLTVGSDLAGLHDPPRQMTRGVVDCWISSSGRYRVPAVGGSQEWIGSGNPGDDRSELDTPGKPWPSGAKKAKREGEIP